jgi:hypothetical protein
MAATEDTTQLADMESRVEALAGLPALLKPYTVTGTKLRLPKEIGDKLCDVVRDQLRPMLDSVHYEGVRYEYQDENDSAPLMEGLRRQAERVV